MEHISKILPRALETSTPSTKEKPVNTGELEKLRDFQTFDDPQLERMRDEAARFMSAYKTSDKPYWLSLLGPCGTGKTFLAKLMGCEVIPWYEIVGWARDGSAKGREKFTDLANARWFNKYEGRLESMEIKLCVDDIGAEYVTDYSRSKLCEFLNRREGHWTVITANLSLEQISKGLDQRIASRMLRHGSVVVEVDALDFNLRT